MNSKILLILFSVTAITILSCNKDSVSKTEKVNEPSLAGETITLKNVSFATNVSEKQAPPNYDEGACTTKVDTT